MGTGDSLSPLTLAPARWQNAGDVNTTERIEITGVVQGVGLRPFVYRLATALGLDGTVANDPAGVAVEVTGPVEAIAEFVRRLRDDAPPLAQIDGVARRPSRFAVGSGFRIVASRVAEGASTPVPPDTAVCDDCRAELFDPTNRRFHHPFITCTNCGPRSTIIRRLPYDRASTTMAGFALCAACAAEYGDPSDRRYHAQPIACQDCGPRLALLDGVGARVASGERALAGAVAVLRSGGVVAVKGLGGFHLACDATDDAAVRRLRAAKARPHKAFAVLVADPAAARRLAHLGGIEAAELTTPAAPIMLLRRRPDAELAAAVAPDSPLIGLMLAHTPIQHLLAAALAVPLVMTSGNVAGMPIAYCDDHLDALRPLCDAVLTHDRPIHAPCDDSVVRVVNGAPLWLRRARGCAPVRLDSAVSNSAVSNSAVSNRAVLAVGGELKNTVCLSSGADVWLSPHIGDLDSAEALDRFDTSIERALSLRRIEPDVVAVDGHPGSRAARWARTRYPDRVVAVQHHHAHVAAVMAERGLPPSARVLGFAFDGTGYGPDGTIWGGEVLLAEAASARRIAHLATVPLAGGDAAVRRPDRVALAHLHAAGVPWSDDLAPVRGLDAIERALLARQFSTGFGCVPTSSMGRLFDAIASLLDLRHSVTFEAQAALDLEFAAQRWEGGDPGLRFGLSEGGFDAAPLIRGLVAATRRGEPTDALARSFHVAVADVVARAAVSARDTLAFECVVLSGGVFQNALLVELCVHALRSVGIEPLTHRLVPPNDGGLALGQAFVAAHAPLGAPVHDHGVDPDTERSD